MQDTDPLCTLEILALTAIGESESLGNQAMSKTINTVMNRAAANLHWMGGSDPRNVCLEKGQYDCWWPQTDNDDRQRIMKIAFDNPVYGPYTTAREMASLAIAGLLPDSTNGAVSYYDSDSCPEPSWAKGKTPCHVDGSRLYFDLAAVT